MVAEKMPIVADFYHRKMALAVLTRPRVC